MIHPLADDRRVLPIDKLGELLQATPEFARVISFNPGYQSVLKDLKQNTRQRFVALEFDYPSAEVEAKIICAETGIAQGVAEHLVKFARMTRNLKGNGLMKAHRPACGACSKIDNLRHSSGRCVSRLHCTGLDG